MGTTQRRAREKESLRRAILDAARDLFVTEDYDAISIRRIADKIEYSPTVIYLHFKDKKDIMLRLIEEGFDILNRQLAPSAAVHDAVERMRGFGRAYMRFAEAHPHYYKLMFQLEGDAALREECVQLESGTRALEYIVRAVAEAVATGRFRPIDPVIGAHVIWANAHGAAALALAGRLNKLHGHTAHDLFEALIETLIRGLSA